VSNFFEQELRKLFGDGKIIHEPVFVGRACVGGLDAGRQVRAEFVTMGHADHYEALRVTLLDNDLGVVDKLTLRLKDVWGKKAIPNNPYLKSGVTPHIWVNDDKTDWYAYHPTPADYQVIRQATSDYLSAFRERVPEHDTRSGPKLVYICTPLRGEAEQNITLAKETARVVFQGGDIPICPNLLFTLIATPGDPVQEQAAQEMGLRLVELCQQVNADKAEAGLADGCHAELPDRNRPVAAGVVVRCAAGATSSPWAPPRYARSNRWRRWPGASGAKDRPTKCARSANGNSTTSLPPTPAAKRWKNCWPTWSGTTSAR